MYINWHGHSCFRLTEKIDNNEVAIVTDPFAAEIGLFPPKLKADIVTISHHHADHDNLEKISPNLDKLFVIDRPGEYEVKKVFVTGIDSLHDKKDGAERGRNTIYKFEIDGLSVVHLGDLGKALTEEQLSAVGDVDILLIPIGGTYTIDGHEAAELVREIEPRIVIPMHYKIKDVAIEGLADETKFLKEMGGRVERMERLKILKKELPAEEATKVIILEKS
jgi:L-ascorbate metabolism protein UlaG (beta-lactamase superfamily)